VTSPAGEIVTEYGPPGVPGEFHHVGVLPAVLLNLGGDCADELLGSGLEALVRRARDGRLVWCLGRLESVDARMFRVRPLGFEPELERDVWMRVQKVREVVVVPDATEFGVDRRPEHRLEGVHIGMIFPIWVAKSFKRDGSGGDRVGQLHIAVHVVDDLIGGNLAWRWAEFFHVEDALVGVFDTL